MPAVAEGKRATLNLPKIHPFPIVCADTHLVTSIDVFPRDMDIFRGHGHIAKARQKTKNKKKQQQKTKQWSVRS